ncbi:NADH-dependent flavin oxidoreductase [Ciborinia camelliae]|nr:NADH-dependent flavin oxidoreductase [Ciborinia camelliae]
MPPYITPAQNPPAGTALSTDPPTLFSPLTIRDVTFQNRIWVSPMCMYSANAGHLTDFHLVHFGAFAYRGASLTIIEGTAVRPEGRVSPGDAGLWEDAQIAGFKRVADFAHSQGQKIGMQLAHAGRKASTMPPWMAPRAESAVAEESDGGWPKGVKAMSALKWGEGYAEPSEMTLEEIQDVIDGFRDAAKRAVEAGTDVIEIHSAHGYLLHSSLSPVTNKRTDRYGGSWENRTRLLIETIKAVREVIPKGMPLLLRISATEWLDDVESWDIPSTIRLAKLLPALGVDLLDVSSAGNSPSQKITMHTNYQTSIAGEIRAALHKDGIKDLKIGCVGLIVDAEAAKSHLEDEPTTYSNAGETVDVKDEQGKIAKADVVLVARQFLREPEWVFRVAYRLGVDVQWPVQYLRGGVLEG